MNKAEVTSLLHEKIPSKNFYLTEEIHGVFGPFRHRAGWTAHVEKVAYCVTASDEILDWCRKKGIGYLMAHHPFIPPMARRGMTQGVTLFIAHTALDCEPDAGLNRQWADMVFGRQSLTPNVMENLGHMGKIKGILFEDLVKWVEGLLESPIIGSTHNRTPGEKIESLAIITGLGGMVARKVPPVMGCYITGQLSQPADSLPFSVIETGHTLSERIGAESLRHYLQGTGVEVVSVPLTMDNSFTGETYL